MGLFSAGSYPSPQGGTGIYAAGGIVTCCNGYKIHTFTSSGTFQVFKGGTGFQYLVIGGGGAGGRGGNSSSQGGGGGGGGGWRCCGNVCVPACGHTVVVGAGGLSSFNGQPSCFYDLVAAGGGAGGAITLGTPINRRGSCGCNGGNGGGAGGDNNFACPNNGAGNTPSTTPSQGFAGGCAVFGSFNGSQAGAGGGGAGATGGNAFCIAGGFPAAGDGGIGKASCISGATAWYSGGGGGMGGISGGAGGCGGGANAGNIPGNAGTPNTGGGGAGGIGPTVGTWEGGTGGSGIVIIRYPI